MVIGTLALWWVGCCIRNSEDRTEQDGHQSRPHITVQPTHRGTWGTTSIFISAKWTEWTGDILWCFDSVCHQSINRLRRHRCTRRRKIYLPDNCFNRNIFDSCVKSWEYFRSDNISLATSFSWLSDDKVRFKIEMGLWRHVQKCQHRFRWIFPHKNTPVTPQHAVVIDDVLIIGRRRIYCASTLQGRCLCKRVDVYIITLSCTWWIYALSERLLVLIIWHHVCYQSETG